MRKVLQPLSYSMKTSSCVVNANDAGASYYLVDNRYVWKSCMTKNEADEEDKYVCIGDIVYGPKKVQKAVDGTKLFDPMRKDDVDNGYICTWDKQ